MGKIIKALKYELTNYADFKNPDIRVTDEAVYQFVVKHSRLIDRINHRKMVEMTFYAFSILSGDLEIPKGFGKDWKFFKGLNKFNY